MALAGLILAACGGSTSDLVWEDFDRTYLTVAARDGYVQSNGTANAVDTAGIVGDIDAALNGLAVVTIYSFDTGGIGNDAVIESAVLRVYQDSVLGAPYTDLGVLRVDHVQIGPGLDAGDYDGNTLIPDIGTLASDAAEEWKTVDITAAVQSDVSAGRAYSEFRLHFETESDNDAAHDAVIVNDGEDTRATGRIPELVVSYRAPRL